MTVKEKTSSFSSSLPQFYISGELHGNERIGPLASLEATKLLLYAYECFYNINRKSCMMPYDLTTVEMAWLAQLLTSRYLLITPILTETFLLGIESPIFA